MPPRSVHVPDIEHPTQCYAQAVTMARCTYPKGHDGPHQWAPTPPIETLNRMVCPQCGSTNRSGASPTIEVVNGWAVCWTCSHTWAVKPAA